MKVMTITCDVCGRDITDHYRFWKMKIAGMNAATDELEKEWHICTGCEDKMWTATSKLFKYDA